jgi:hypothetical protein
MRHIDHRASTGAQGIAMLQRLLVAALLAPLLALAKDPPLEGVCARIDKQINTLLNINVSECVPGKGTTPGTYSLLFMAKKPLLGDAQNRRAWLLAVVGGAGWAMAELPEMKGVRISEVVTTDPTLAKSSKVIALSGPSVKQWRQDISSGKVEALAVYAAIEKGAIERVVKRP